MSLIDSARQSLRGRLAASLVVGSVMVLSLSFIALHMIIRSELYAHLDQDLSLRMRAVADYATAHPGPRASLNSCRSSAPGRTRTSSRSGTAGAARSPGRTRVPGVICRISKPLSASLRTTTCSYRMAIVVVPRRNRSLCHQGIPVGIDSGHRRGDRKSRESREPHTHRALAGSPGDDRRHALDRPYSIVRGLRPLDDLARELEGVNPEDPQARLNAGPLPSELRPVATSFSALLDRLLDALAREKRYARNVAHELRTPLAEMRLLADVGSSGQDPDVIRAAIRDIGVTAAEMERIVESLLALTRYEAGLESPQPEPIDLCAELRRQAAAMKAAADQRGLTIQLHLPGELWVHADSTLVRRLVANLLGNAIAHTPQGSVVNVLLNPGGELRLVNPAPNLVASDVPRLAERFFRISTGNGGSHAGLGLSLAAAIAKILQLRLVLTLSRRWLPGGVGRPLPVAGDVDRAR